MASEREWELVCGAVDGELAPEAWAEYRALVAGSAAASALHGEFARQSRSLAELARVGAPPGLTEAVLAGVRAGPAFGVPIVVSPAPLAPTLPRPRRRSLAGPVALAAAVAVGVLLSLDRPPKREVAVAPPRLPERGFDPAPARPGLPLAIAPAPNVAPRPAPQQVEVAERAPPPRPLRPPAVEGGVTFAAEPRFVTLAPRTPFVVPLAELDAPQRTEEARELGAAHAVIRGDLFARDPAPALEALRGALKTIGVVSSGDAPRDPAGGWAFYSEHLAAGDRARLLAALAGAARAGTIPGATLHLYPATAADARDFRELTGVDRGFWTRPRAPAGATRAEPRTRPKLALVVPLAPGPRPAPTLGAEAKAFWRNADPTPDGAILIVCRGA